MSDIMEFEQEAGNIINTLESPALINEARELQAFSEMDDLKKEVIGFFKNRIASISRAERIKELVYEQLEVNIQSGALNFDQFMTLLMRLDRDNNDSADSLLRAMTGSNGNPGSGGSSLFTDIVRPGSEKSDMTKAFENYTPEELRKVNEVAKVLRDIIESGERVEINTSGKHLPGMTTVDEVN